MRNLEQKIMDKGFTNAEFAEAIGFPLEELHLVLAGMIEMPADISEKAEAVLAS